MTSHDGLGNEWPSLVSGRSPLAELKNALTYWGQTTIRMSRASWLRTASGRIGSLVNVDCMKFRPCRFAQFCLSRGRVGEY